MNDSKLQFAHLTVEVKRKSIKHIYLRVYPPNGHICISVPQALSHQAITNFLSSKFDWIISKQTAMKNHPHLRQNRMEDGTLHPYLGQDYQLKIYQTKAPCTVILHENILELKVNPPASDACIAQVLQNWYRGQMKTLLPPLIQKWETIIGVQVSAWGIKQMKTRWGSCNTKAKRIWLNLELIKKPLLSLESVLVHEMVHLLEPSHNKRFYALMDQAMPQWRLYQKPLKMV